MGLHSLKILPTTPSHISRCLVTTVREGFEPPWLENYAQNHHSLWKMFRYHSLPPPSLQSRLCSSLLKDGALSEVIIHPSCRVLYLCHIDDLNMLANVGFFDCLTHHRRSQQATYLVFSTRGSKLPSSLPMRLMIKISYLKRNGRNVYWEQGAATWPRDWNINQMNPGYARNSMNVFSVQSTPKCWALFRTCSVELIETSC